MDHDDSSTSVTDEEEDGEIEISKKEVISSSHQMSPKPQCDQPIMDEQQSISDMHQFERDKKSVYKHPLFPLLGMNTVCIIFYHLLK